MEPLIRALNDPKNQGSPAHIHQIQKQLQVLQRETSAWQAALDFLQNQDALIRFYGALTLTIKINADWKTDKFSKDTDARSSLLEALLSSYIRLALLEDENYVLQKLASTLATLYQKLGAEWPSPVRHIFGSLLQGQYVPSEQLPPMAGLLGLASQRSAKQIASILRLSVTLAEDVNSKAPGSTTQQQLSLSCSDTLELLSHVLTGYCQTFIDPSISSNPPQLNFPQADFTMLSRSALEALPLWTGLLKLQEAHAPKAETQSANKQAVLCTSMALKALQNNHLATPALHALVMIQTLSPRLLSKADSRYPQSFATSEVARGWVSSLVHGDPSTEAMAFVDLLDAIMLQVDTTSPDYIHSGRYHDMMNLLLTMLRCEGTAGVDDEVCQMMLETINTIVEGHTDWDPDPEAENFLKQFVGQACEACLAKAKMPEEEMNFSTRSWDRDDRSKFQDFRFEVQDFLQSAFGLLGPPLIQAIVTRTTSAPDWRDFEGSLYCLVAFADTMTAEPEIYDSLIASILEGAHFREVVHSQNVPDMARKTCIKFISEMTSYFKRHPNLMEILSFLFSSLHLPASATIASRAIYTLCDSQRSSLTEALGGFIASLNTIQDLRGMERHRIYGAVAAVVQSINNESAKVQPLTEILGLLARDVEASHVTSADEENFLEQNTDLLQTLAAIGRGLRAPDDTPVDLENVVSSNSGFWINGPGSNVQHQTLQIYKQVIERVGSRASSEFIEASCDFVRSGFTEMHPSPFKFTSPISVDLVTQNVSIHSPNIDVVMGSAASLLAAASPEEFGPQYPRLLQPILLGIQQLLNSNDRISVIRDSTYAAASLDFMSRSLPRWGNTLLELDEAQEAFALCLELGLLVIAEPDTLPRRSAAHLFGAFVELSKAGKVPHDSPAQRNLHALGESYQPRIIASFMRLVGGECARSELDVFSEQIRRYVHNQPMLFKSIAREAMKDDNRVLTDKALQATTQEQRDRFISQVDGLRGARKTNEVVRDFWVACRGSDFEYIT
ncbi:uncharacterized protein HMPREF1541_04916 [Cyphellophora europaea CBS 101466]|uniref:Importin N-terminal domain-containing protein n=1 Tax=Cyphellophora europaea (strain CBS 101466) TaxID=1220924 RepID=W2RW06_CYPE1|nr:uncharacterized protein HMPREF1541_04916 [Cyphellophora europaea CBS 101466]ETN40637.1 hypothetical protein HMPREF1541_04916 [Cyphellophora europaea CBS 101466]